jgi:hypothetical protein
LKKGGWLKWVDYGGSKRIDREGAMAAITPVVAPPAGLLYFDSK